MSNILGAFHTGGILSAIYSQSLVSSTENSEMALSIESGTKTEQLAPKNIENGTKDELDDDELAIYNQFYFTTGN